MSSIRKALLITAFVAVCAIRSFAAQREFTFDKKYLNLPVKCFTGNETHWGALLFRASSMTTGETRSPGFT